MAAVLTQTVWRLIFTQLLYFIVSIGATKCTYYDYSDHSDIDRECFYGCCVFDCCEKSYTSYTSSTSYSSSFYIGPIIGSLVSLGVLIFIIIVSICICRRRRQPGVVIHSTGAAPGVVVQQSTVATQGGVNTTGLPPGIAYPPSYGAYPYPPDANFQAQGPPAYFHQGPPSYNNLPPPVNAAEKTENVYQNQRGVVNTAFNG